LAPATAGPSKPQKRQATQAPHGNAHSSGVPKKCRKIVTSSKPQDFLSQMIASKLIHYIKTWSCSIILSYKLSVMLLTTKSLC